MYVMTAQVALLTSSCAVIAADSAVTVSRSGPRRGRKVYTGVEKIYPLSDTEPLAALVYGTASLVDVPWSSLLNGFRAARGPAAATSLDGLGLELMQYARDQLHDHLNESGDELRLAHTRVLVREMLGEAQDRVFRVMMGADDEMDPEQLPQRLGEAAREIVQDERQGWKDQPLVDGVTASKEKTLHQAARPMVREVINDVFRNVRLNSHTKRAMGDAVLFSFTRAIPDEASTQWSGGVVLAGFTNGALWPSYAELRFDGIGLEWFRHWKGEADACSGPGDAQVRAFAEHEGIATIMNGVHPEYGEMLYSAVVDAGVSEGDAEEVMEQVADTWDDKRTQPILSTLDPMPLPDLCEIAESLVAITGLWHRIRGTLETVGGPISVAVLRPGEPMRWAKRPKLMPH